MNGKGNDIFTCAAVALAALLAGCSTPRRLVEPAAIPTMVSYATPALGFSASTLPVEINVADCPEYAFLTRKSVSGVTRIVCPFPVRSIVEREFSRLVAATFAPPTVRSRPVAVLKVSARRAILRKDGRDAFCEMELEVTMHPPYEDRKPYFRKIYNVMAGGRFTRDELVPECVYEAVQDAVRSFMVDLPSSSAELARLTVN